MKKTIKNIILFLLPTIFLSCNSSQNVQIQITSETLVAINNKNLTQDEKGLYTYSSKSNYPTILTLSKQKLEWEIYLEPNKTVGIEIKGDSILFNGDLINENQYLLSEKLLNAKIEAFLNNNWYNLHKKNELGFIKSIDSIKSIYIKNMNNVIDLNTSFRELNTASINYAFDRMIIRYPKNHKYLTDKEVVIPNKYLQSSKLRLDNLKFSKLLTYKKYTKTWLDLEVEKSLKGIMTQLLIEGWSKQK